MTAHELLAAAFDACVLVGGQPKAITVSMQVAYDYEAELVAQGRTDPEFRGVPVFWRDDIKGTDYEVSA